MKKVILFAIAAIGAFFCACTKEEKQSLQTSADTTATKRNKDMNSYVSIFEIPATDFSRAVDFYQTILSIDIQKVDIPEMQIGVFPYEGQMVNGVILKAEGYKPSADGVTIYLNGGDNLQVILDKVEKNGGRILTAKTLHADESGYFAIFLDSEGNKIGLHSLH
jgi:predicted enzyme related to lactoylglutathione lyase